MRSIILKIALTVSGMGSSRPPGVLGLEGVQMQPQPMSNPTQVATEPRYGGFFDIPSVLEFVAQSFSNLLTGCRNVSSRHQALSLLTQPRLRRKDIVR